MSRFPVNRPHFDYLRVVTWDRNIHDRWVEMLGDVLVADEVGAGRFENYKGMKSAHAFIGMGLQQDSSKQVKQHYLMNVSGWDAERVKDEVDSIGGWYRRLDYCVTVDMPKGWNADMVAVSLRERGVKHGAAVGMRSDRKSDGTTIGFGERGEIVYYARLYEKAAIDGVTPPVLSHLRMEVEALKEGCELTSTRAGLQARLKERIAGLPYLGNDEDWQKAYGIMLYSMLDVLDDGELRRKVSMKRKSTNTWAWLSGTVAKSMTKYGRSSPSNRRDILNLMDSIRSSIDNQ